MLAYIRPMKNHIDQLNLWVGIDRPITRRVI